MSIIDSILKVFFPEHCAGCGRSGTALCTTCKGHIPLSEPLIETTNAIAIYTYSDPIIRKAIWELKYHRKSSVMKCLLEDISVTITDKLQHLEGYDETKNIVLVPIPQHYTKTFSRGFNQSKLIANWLQPSIAHATVTSILKKTTATISQAHTQSKTERKQHMVDTMQVTLDHLDPDILYIVVDDVITTGSTVDEASRALRAAGARYVYAIAVAHGHAK